MVHSYLTPVVLHSRVPVFQAVTVPFAQSYGLFARDPVEFEGVENVETGGNQNPRNQYNGNGLEFKTSHSTVAISTASSMSIIGISSRMG